MSTVKKNLFFCFSLLLLSVACKQSDPVPEPEEEDISLDFGLTRLLDTASTATEQGYGGTYNFLGYGYDLTGKYAHTGSVREAVVNTPGLVDSEPNRFDFSRITGSGFYSLFAVDAQDFIRQLNSRFHSSIQSVDSTTYFRGSVTQPFTQADALSDKYLYGQYDLYVTLTRPTLYFGDDALAAHLTDAFRADCESLSAQDLVRKYGTHILTSLYTGMKLSIDYQAAYTGSAREAAIRNSFTIGLAETFGLFSGVLDAIDSTALKGIAEPKLVFEAIGGDTSKIALNQSGQGARVDYLPWRQSINEENARFIYLDRTGGIRPLYEVIADEQKKQEVKSYIEAYLTAQ